MWGVGFRIVKGLEGCGEVNEVDNDRFGRLWGLAGNGVGEVQCFKTRGKTRDTLFCPMFDEYFNPSPSVAQPVLEVAVQDTPSTSISQTIKEAQSHVIPTSVEEDDHGIVLHTWIMICNLVFQFQNLVLKNPLPELLSQPTPVSTRLLLQTKALFCYYDALLSSSEHKSYKDALTKSCWIDAMKSSMSLNIWRFGS
ncbi:hypothetical protein Tco_1114800 [Tanacetum coccineum]